MSQVTTADEPLLLPRCWATTLDDDEHLWICMLERGHEPASDHVSASYVSLSGNPPVLAVQTAERPKMTWKAKLPPTAG